MATLRRDGFTSLEIAATVPQSAGVAITKPLIFTGSHLFVNFGLDGDSRLSYSNTGHTAASLVVAVLDAATGQPIAPFNASNIVTKDSVRQPVTWASGGATAGREGAALR